MSKPKPCKHLDVPPRKDGKVVAYTDRTYRCTVEVPEPALPNSIRGAYGYRWPVSRGFMSVGSCEGCPFYEPRNKPAD